MPITPLPSHKTIELPKSSDHHPYVVHDPCQGEGQFELHDMLFDVAPDQSVRFHLNTKGVLKNTGNVELTVTTPGD